MAAIDHVTRDTGSSAEFDLQAAQSWIEGVVKKFETLDLDIMTDCFTDDVEINYVGCDQMHGKDAVRAFLASRYTTVTNYSLEKVARCVTNNVVGIDATVSFDDTSDGSRKFGRAFEFLTVRDGKICRWDNISLYVTSDV